MTRSGSTSDRPGADTPPAGKPTEGATPPRRAGSAWRPLWIAALAVAFLAAVAFAIVIYRVTDAARGASVQRVVEGHSGSPLRTSQPDFAERAAALADVELEGGHRVEVLPDTLVFTRLFEDLTSAQGSISFLGYYCEPGQLGDRIAEVLAERARAGVTVLFLGDDFGCGDLLEEIQPSLQSAGVRVGRFRPVRWHTLPRVQHRLHSRAVVIDGVVGYTGGFGISDKWVRDTVGDPRWRDTAARFTGPAVAELQATFLSAWAEATGELLTSGVFFPAAASVVQATSEAPAQGAPADRGMSTAGAGSQAGRSNAEAADVTAGLLYSRPVMGPTAAERYLAVTLAAAERTLYVANSYFVPTPLIVELLVAAVGRGVDVRLLLPDEHTDIPSTRYAGRSFYHELLAAGVRIFEYQPSMMHAKTMVVDGRWVAVGTLNMDNRSMRLNDESALLVHDEVVGAFMDSLFLADLAQAQEITAQMHDARPLRERLFEWLSRWIAPLL